MPKMGFIFWNFMYSLFASTQSASSVRTFSPVGLHRHKKSRAVECRAFAKSNKHKLANLKETHRPPKALSIP